MEFYFKSMGKGIPRMGIYSTPDSTRLPDGGLRILHDSKRLLDYLAQQVVPAGIGQFLIVLLQDPQVLYQRIGSQHREQGNQLMRYPGGFLPVFSL